MNDTRKFGAITSSTNPEEIANRVKGAVLALSSVIILVAAHLFGVTLNASDIVMLATEVGAVAGAVWTIYGFCIWALATYFKRS